jgi:hypothetical protein
MSRVRVYLPATLPALADAGVNGRLPAAQIEVAPRGSTAYAVTPALREWYREGDLDELEYVALTRAAVASLRLLASRRIADRRVVLAADVADDALVLDPSLDPAAIAVLSAVYLADVVSAHVDDPEVAHEVRAAADLLDAAESGDGDAQFAIDGLDDHELQWYAVQEIGFLLG